MNALFTSERLLAILGSATIIAGSLRDKPGPEGFLTLGL